MKTSRAVAEIALSGERLGWAALTMAFGVIGNCGAQGTMRITFDGPPPQPPGTAYAVQYYAESGISFTPINPSAPFTGFGRVGSNPPPPLPDDGTAYLDAVVGESLKFSSASDYPLNLIAVDLAEYSTVVPNAVTVHFVGYRPDGSTVTTDFTTDGIIDGTGPLTDFQTFYFGSEFSGLSRVEIPSIGWSLDNLVLSVPEPAPAALMVGGLGALIAMRYRTGWRSRKAE